MKEAWFGLAMLIAVPALAQTAMLDEQDAAMAAALIRNAKLADTAAKANDADVTAIVINLQVKGAEKGEDAVIGLVPADPQFAQVLAAIKAAAGNKVKDADDKLKAMGLARKGAR